MSKINFNDLIKETIKCFISYMSNVVSEDMLIVFKERLSRIEIELVNKNSIPFKYISTTMTDILEYDISSKCYYDDDENIMYISNSASKKDILNTLLDILCLKHYIDTNLVLNGLYGYGATGYYLNEIYKDYFLSKKMNIKMDSKYEKFLYLIKTVESYVGEKELEAIYLTSDYTRLYYLLPLEGAYPYTIPYLIDIAIITNDFSILDKLNMYADNINELNSYIKRNIN